MLPYACNFLSIGCEFTRWGIDGDRNRVSLGYACSGDSLFRDTGRLGAILIKNRHSASGSGINEKSLVLL